MYDFMSKLIDLKSHSVNTVFNLLLKDRTTNKNIIFATDAYDGIDFTTPITKKLLFNSSVDIRPRVLKSLEEQTQRTRKKAEVFTPAWICNQMNNYCDTEWFGREKIFNVEQDHTWIPTTEKITFLNGKSWKNYVDSTRLEITCGEAPYLVSRYDVATAEIIPIEQRIGILDRKLRVINENVDNYKSWNQWVYRAFKSVYGYEFQGDNLLIARINLLETFCEYTRERWQVEPTDSALRQIANIISWNLWQMDGIHGVIPYIGEAEEQNEPYQMSLFETEKKPLETIDCKVYDWCKNKEICYKSMRGGNAMKFDFCIGNPPYQDNTLGDNKTYAPPVYNKFLDAAYTIADKVEMIHPARFLFNAGSTPKDWNKKMLNNPHFKVLYYEQDSSKIFADTDIKGGISITYYDPSQEFGAIEIFTAFQELNSTFHKVHENKEFKSFSEIIFSAYSYHFTKFIYEDNPNLKSRLSKGHEYDLKSNAFELLKEIFLDKKPNNESEYIQILGRENNQRVFKWIKRAYITEPKNFTKYKVFMAGAVGSGAIGEVLSTPLIGMPLVGNTESFISIGSFETLQEAENCIKYVKTKFARAMLGILKVTQAITPQKWKYVPLQDFTSSSDIDWTQSIANIDQQLYKKYNLSEEEIYFIETNVKEME